MPYDPQIHHRRSIRLINYDYSQAGAYFITLVTRVRKNIFANINAGELALSAAGELAKKVLLALPDHYPAVEIDEFIFMPNHLHAVLVIGAGPPGGLVLPEPGLRQYSISEIVRGFKTYSSRQINLLFHTPGSQIWQHGFYDHILRDAEDLRRVRAYIRDNPRKWFEDVEYRG